MVLMFDKETLEGRWFRDTELETGPEDTTGYTDKVPPSTAYAFDEESDEWVLNEKVFEGGI